ncbi:MAG: lipopolysaccharide heptosyltransferase II [Nitrospirae bacterium]|nr:lipopolysaccharide heptosyltransferase II [Nitrospirota bacterium]
MIKKTPEKILIVKPSSLGDVVHSLPFLDSLRACFPKAGIHWVIAKGLEGLLEGHPMINRLIIIDKDRWKRFSDLRGTMRELRDLFTELKQERYDIVVDLQGLLRSGMITMSTGARVRIGFDEAREGSRNCYTRRVKGGRDIHAVDRYLRIAEALGCDTENVTFPFPLRAATVDNPLRDEKDYIVIVPGARWNTKIWPAEGFGRLAAMLSLKSVVVGSKGDALIAEEVVKASGGKAVSLAGRTTLAELVDIMRNAGLVISNDSGPMHIAAGFHVPVVAIFGPTSPLRTGPYGKGHAVITSDVRCSPCFKKTCRDLLCMKGISVDDVYEKVREILASPTM